VSRVEVYAVDEVRELIRTTLLASGPQNQVDQPGAHVGSAVSSSQLGRLHWRSEFGGGVPEQTAPEIGATHVGGDRIQDPVERIARIRPPDQDLQASGVVLLRRAVLFKLRCELAERAS